MKEPKQLTSKSGESEWSYKGRILIAVPDEGFCIKCIFNTEFGCIWKESGLKITCTDFKDAKVVFKMKPAETK